jgi:hypothetical protein
MGWGIEGIFTAAAAAMCMFGLAIAASVRLGAWRVL